MGQKIKHVILICLDIFRDFQRLYLPRTFRLLNNKVSFGLKNKKLIKKLLVLECRNCDVKLRNV